MALEYIVRMLKTYSERCTYVNIAIYELFRFFVNINLYFIKLVLNSEHAKFTVWIVEIYDCMAYMSSWHKQS